MEHIPVIELFSIGTELILGQIQDTNAHWIAQQVLQLGGTLRRATMLRDEADEMLEALEDSVSRKTDLILTTGGLGPTPDDMTVEIIANIIGTRQVVHEALGKPWLGGVYTMRCVLLITLTHVQKST